MDAAVPEAFPDVGGLSENVAMRTPISESTITGATHTTSDPRRRGGAVDRAAAGGSTATGGSAATGGSDATGGSNATGGSAAPPPDPALGEAGSIRVGVSSVTTVGAGVSGDAAAASSSLAPSSANNACPSAAAKSAADR